MLSKANESLSKENRTLREKNAAMYKQYHAGMIFTKLRNLYTLEKAVHGEKLDKLLKHVDILKADLQAAEAKVGNDEEVKGTCFTYI